jgi:hypothetical protein
VNPISNFLVEDGQGGAALRFTDLLADHDLAGSAQYRYEVSQGAGEKHRDEKATVSTSRILLGRTVGQEIHVKAPLDKTFEALLEQLGPEEFARAYGNQWVATTARVIPAAAWVAAGDAGQDLPLLQAGHQFGALLGAALLEDGAARHDDVAARAVHLEDLERLRRAQKRGDVAHRADIDLAARQERHGAAQIDGEAALHPAEDRAHDTLLVVEGLLEHGPGLLAPRLLARQDGLAFLVLHAIDEDVDHVAFLHFRRARPVGELAQSDAALGLEADIDGDEIVGDANDRAFDDRSFEARRTAQRFVEECCKF